MKYGVIEQMRQQYPAPPMCRFLSVSTSGYYAWRKRPLSLHDQQEPGLEAQVRGDHERSRQTFGPERLQKDLANHGVQVGVLGGDNYLGRRVASRRNVTRRIVVVFGFFLLFFWVCRARSARPRLLSILLRFTFHSAFRRTGACCPEPFFSHAQRAMH